MNKSNSNTPSTPAPVYTGPPLAANVSFELTNAELQQLIDLCAANALFSVGLKLAERKASLRANVRRMEKEAAALQPSG